MCKFFFYCTYDIVIISIIMINTSMIYCCAIFTDHPTLVIHVSVCVFTNMYGFAAAVAYRASVLCVYCTVSL